MPEPGPGGQPGIARAAPHGVREHGYRGATGQGALWELGGGEARERAEEAGGAPRATGGGCARSGWRVARALRTGGPVAPTRVAEVDGECGDGGRLRV